MNCDETRQCLDEAFDAAIEPGVKVKAHLALCASCATYASRLEAFDAGFRNRRPAEVPEDLADRIKARITGEAARATGPTAVHWGIGLVACLALALTAWFHPPSGNIRIGRLDLDVWQDGDLWRAASEPFAVPFRELWAMATPLIENGLGRFPNLWLWSIAGAATLLLVLFNVYEAHSLESGQKHAARRHVRG